MIGFMEAMHRAVNDFRMTMRYKYLILELDGDELISIDDTDRERIKFYCTNEENEAGSVSIISEGDVVIVYFNGIFATIERADIIGNSSMMIVPVTSLRMRLIDKEEEE